MPKRKPTISERMDQAEAELVELRTQISDLGEVTDDLAEHISELPNSSRSNPGPTISPEGRDARSRNAAKARASKLVGKGAGKVRTRKTQQKLQEEAGIQVPKRRRRQ